MLRRNPYASKAQHRLFRALEARGQLPRGTASRWMRETPYYSWLPERIGYYSLGQAPTPPVAPAPAAPPTEPTYEETFWQRHGAEIIVGTVTAVTGALAVYFAMRVVEPSKLMAR